MPQTVEADYHDGIVELKRKPVGIHRAKALVIFLDDADEAAEHRAVDIERVRIAKSSVDKWIGILEGTEIGDWKAERRASIEEKSCESSC